MFLISNFKSISQSKNNKTYMLKFNSNQNFLGFFMRILCSFIVLFNFSTLNRKIFILFKVYMHMNLKEIRVSKGLTQKQMAEKMAMEQTTYSKKERGISPINANERKRLSEIFEIPIEDLHKLNCPLTTKNEHKNQQII